jgi:hypothetical protein
MMIDAPSLIHNEQYDELYLKNTAPEEEKSI